MELDKIEKLIALIKSQGIQEFELKDGETSIRLVQQNGAIVHHQAQGFPTNQLPAFPYPTYPQAIPPQSLPTAPATTSQKTEKAGGKKIFEIRSPFVGTYYGSPSPGSEEFVHVGKKVKKGDTLCIIEAMKLMNEIEAEQDGTIVEVCGKNEQPVEYNQVLFLME